MSTGTVSAGKFQGDANQDRTLATPNVLECLSSQGITITNPISVTLY
ncbi:MAG: hypothetical protein V7L21_09215 [Nostoc sp.]|nr:hypothetical protein [Nostoc sp. NMS9]MBN3944255.1 hypothetical protein [Nostoc sp. NMS9]